jgi:hypothetical protein
MGADDVDGKFAQRNDDEYRDQKGHRNPHQDAHVKSSSQPSANIREVDLVNSFPITVFLRPAVNNRSLVDAAFRYRKPDRLRPQAGSASCHGRGIWENATK